MTFAGLRPKLGAGFSFAPIFARFARGVQAMFCPYPYNDRKLINELDKVRSTANLFLDEMRNQGRITQNDWNCFRGLMYPATAAPKIGDIQTVGRMGIPESGWETVKRKVEGEDSLKEAFLNFQLAVGDLREYLCTKRDADEISILNT